MIPRSTDGKVRVLSLSYGKDSMACLGAIEQLGWTLDRIVTADVWATDTIPADLPPMVEFKDYADKAILEQYGIVVEHYCAVDADGKKTNFDKEFYKTYKSGKNAGKIFGFPSLSCNWCNSHLKVSALKAAESSSTGAISYIGIAADEPNRFHNLTDEKLSPLVGIGWTEADCRAWCEKNNLLSPIYTQATRGGCWFCRNQGVQQLRLLRKQYPNLWKLLLKWDEDSPITFRMNFITVHDFDRRFALEDEGLIAADDKIFRWSMLDGELNYRLF